MNKIAFSKSLIISVLCYTIIISCAHPVSSNPPKNIQDSISIQANYVDLSYAAEKSVHAVVHIKTEFVRKNSLWEEFFGDRFLEEFFGIKSSQHPVVASGSGVIIDQSGYIVTNNHVVQDAQKITVTLNNKRAYNATIVGTDPQTDLALIKIDGQNLPFLTFANSDDVKIGEWVLAVGNPFNLTSTVTAGIVSAKARNLNILGDNASVESFIQTDAAVNQGNSGGALVNTTGNLVGINTAIASGTGYFTGYSFAIPSNIAKKVVEDLQNYGVVRRAVLGISMVEVDNQIAEELHLSEVKGIYIHSVEPNGAAALSGLTSGDVILEIDKHSVGTASELREILAQHSPKDKVSVKYIRKGTEKNIEVELK